MKTAGIYIHIPFCKNKCNYCDYYCLEKREHDMEVFIKMLQREIELTADNHKKDWLFDTIYFGGGSPALLPPKDVNDILDKLNNQFNIAKHIEVTMEINPGETKKDELLSFKDLGVNRLSIGFQTLDQSLLNTLSRTHNSGDCFKMYEDAREANFENISIDMLYSIPKQSVDIWMKNLKIVSDLRPDHIAVYPLTIEEGTPLSLNVKSGEILPVHKEIELKMFKQGSQFLSENEFMQYEVAHFAKPGKKSKHNQHYWNLEPNLAFGPSAHGYDRMKRWWNVSSLNDYLRKLGNNEKPVAGSETLNSINQFNETVIFGLRTKNGLQIEKLQNFEIKYSLESQLNKWANYLEISKDIIRIKPGHYHLADVISTDMLISN